MRRQSGKSGLPEQSLKQIFPVIVGSFVLLGACAAGPGAVAPGGSGFNDPYEATNRAVHEFNKDVDRALLRPAGRVAAALPPVIREPVSNFADNVGLPGKVLNGLMQGDVGGALTNTMRFVLNSTVGLFGLLDPAGEVGIEEQDTDFGETLAVWGVPEGAYLELPLLGPSTERDAVGRIVDFVIDPLDRVGSPEMTDWGTTARAADLVIERGSFGDTIDSVLYDSADSYAQTRLLYLQNRRFELGEDAGAAVDPYAADAYIDPYEALQ